MPWTARVLGGGPFGGQFGGQFGGPNVIVVGRGKGGDGAIVSATQAPQQLGQLIAQYPAYHQQCVPYQPQPQLVWNGWGWHWQQPALQPPPQQQPAVIIVDQEEGGEPAKPAAKPPTPQVDGAVEALTKATATLTKTNGELAKAVEKLTKPPSPPPDPSPPDQPPAPRFSKFNVAAIVLFVVAVSLGATAVAGAYKVNELHDAATDAKENPSDNPQYLQDRTLALGLGAGAAFCFTVATLMTFYSGLKIRLLREKEKEGRGRRLCVTFFAMAAWILFCLSFLVNVIILVLAFEDDQLVYPEVVLGSFLGSLVSWLLMFAYSMLAKHFSKKKG